MGKVEDLRKMREARYEERRAAKKIDPALVLPVVMDQVTARDIDDHKEAPYLCGHKGVGGKTCTRPKNHQEKNHRYK